MNWHLPFIFGFIFLSVAIFGLEQSKNDEDVVTKDPLIDTSIESPISSASSKKSSNVSASDEDVKKSIQAKVKKLRQLKLEARQIASQLRRERRIKAISGAADSGATKEGKEERIEKFKKWKNRMRRRVKALIKRVAKMEKVMKIRKSELQNIKQKRKQQLLVSTAAPPFGITVIPAVRKNKNQHKNQGKKRNNNKPATTVSPAMTLTTTKSSMTKVSTSTIPSTAIAQTPIVTTQKAKVLAKRSHFGIDGSPCETHKDCAPGHCCHRFGALHGVHSAVCLRHDAKEGSHCEHSCACMGSLKCVKSSNPRSHASEQAHCRRLTPKEFAHSTSSSSSLSSAYPSHHSSSPHSPKTKSHSSNNRYHLRYN